MPPPDARRSAAAGRLQTAIHSIAAKAKRRGTPRSGVSARARTGRGWGRFRNMIIGNSGGRAAL